MQGILPMTPTTGSGASCGVHAQESSEQCKLQLSQTLPAYVGNNEKPSKHPGEVPMDCCLNIGPAPQPDCTEPTLGRQRSKSPSWISMSEEVLEQDTYRLNHLLY